MRREKAEPPDAGVASCTTNPFVIDVAVEPSPPSATIAINSASDIQVNSWSGTLVSIPTETLSGAYSPQILAISRQPEIMPAGFACSRASSTAQKLRDNPLVGHGQVGGYERFLGL